MIRFDMIDFGARAVYEQLLHCQKEIWHFASSASSKLTHSPELTWTRLLARRPSWLILPKSVVSVRFQDKSGLPSFPDTWMTSQGQYGVVLCFSSSVVVVVVLCWRCRCQHSSELLGELPLYRSLFFFFCYTFKSKHRSNSGFLDFDTQL